MAYMKCHILKRQKQEKRRPQRTTCYHCTKDLLVESLVVDVQVLVHQLCGSHDNHHFSILLLGIPKLRFLELLLKVKNFFFIALLSPQCQTVVSFYSVYVLFQLLMLTRKGEMISENHCSAFGNLSRKSPRQVSFSTMSTQQRLRAS